MNLKKFSRPEYWKRDSREWGSVSDWDIFYINSIPGVSKAQAHNMLGTELSIICKDCPKNSREYQNAIVLKASLKNCKKDQGNIELWREHSQKLGSLAVENRVHKREILTTGIRAATGAIVAEFPSLKRNFESYSSDNHDETSTKKVKGIPETADYGSNEQYPSLALSSIEDNPLQTLSQSSTEDNLIEKVKEKDIEKLIDFLQKQNLFLNENHFEALRKNEIVGRDFIMMDKQDFKECGLGLGPAIRLADFVKKLNDQKTLPETTSEESTEVSIPANVDTKPIICEPTYPGFPDYSER
ncbi:15805_t:CDS:2, partial [Gigaspora rosea]